MAEDWSAGIPYGPAWPAKLAAARCRVADGAERVVELALGIGHDQELQRLRRQLSDPHLQAGDATRELLGQWALRSPA